MDGDGVPQTRTLVASREFSIVEGEPLFVKPDVSPVALLFDADRSDDIGSLLALARQYLTDGCVSISCLGDAAEELHDELDSVVEDYEASDVVTTWHSTLGDACEYLMFGPPVHTLRICFVRSSADLIAELRKAAGSP